MINSTTESPPCAHISTPITDSHRELVRAIWQIEIDPNGPPLVEQSAKLVAESESKAIESALREPAGFYKDLSEACDAVGAENCRLTAQLAEVNNGLAKACKVIEAGEKDRRQLVALIAILSRALSQSRDANACVSYGRTQIDAVEAANAALKLVPGGVADAIVITTADAASIRRLAASSVSPEVAADVLEILDGKAVPSC